MNIQAFSAENPAVLVVAAVGALAGILALFIPDARRSTRFLVLGLGVGLLWFAARQAEPKPAIPTPPQPPPPPSPLTVEQQRNLFLDAFNDAARGDCIAALHGYDLIEENAPHFPTIAAQKAYCLRQLGQLQAAADYAQRAVKEASENPDKLGRFRLGDAHYILSGVKFVIGDRATALENLRKAVDQGFPYGCNIRGDADLDAMENDSRFAPLTKKIRANGTKECSEK
jgi:tetratricopeptide (TPR) repeat protein